MKIFIDDNLFADLVEKFNENVWFKAKIDKKILEDL